MDKITVYIAKTLSIVLLLVILLFVGLEFIFSVVNELRYVGTGDYGIWQALSYITWTIPSNIAQMFPMAALVATLLGLGLLASRSELIVLRASGLSIGNIITAVLKLAGVLVVVVWILGEWIAPMTDKVAYLHKASALSSGQALRTTKGIWMRDGNDFVHIQNMQSDKHLEGITRYQFNFAMELQKVSYAAFAEYVHDHWVLFNIDETHFFQDQIEQDHLTKRDWVSHISPDIISIVAVKDLDELTIFGLWQTIRYRLSNHLDPKPYQLAFWQKVLRPIATLTMMFLAIPFVFGPLRSTSMGLKMLVGILVGFSFYTVNQLFGPLTLVYQIPPVLGALFPTMLFLLMGFILLKKAR